MQEQPSGVNDENIDPRELLEFMREGQQNALEPLLERMGSTEGVLAFSRRPEDARSELLLLMGPQRAADLVKLLPEPLGSDAIDALEPAAAARILERMPSNERADVIGELDDRDARAIIEYLSEADAHDMRRLSAYPDDVAGGLLGGEL